MIRRHRSNTRRARIRTPTPEHPAESCASREDRGMAKNVLGSELEPCSYDPLTGFYRNGCCDTGAEDLGLHTVCIEATAEFLEFSKSVGNDLSTPMPEYH